MCKTLNIKLIFGTPYKHTATGLVERGNKTVNDFTGTNLADNCNLNEDLYRPLMVMRRTVHSKIKETLFERHYGRKPRTELISYFNLPSNVVSAKPETFQVYSFASKNEDYDQLVIKNTPQTEV